MTTLGPGQVNRPPDGTGDNLERDRRNAREEARAERDRLRDQAREEAERALPDSDVLDEETGLSVESFIEPPEGATGPIARLDRSEMYRLREEHRIDTTTWNSESLLNLVRLNVIYNDFENLGLLGDPENEKVFNTMFYILRNGAEYFAAESTSDEHKTWLRDPLTHGARLRENVQADEDSNFVGGAAYLAAFERLMEIKMTVNFHESDRRSLEERRRDLAEGRWDQQFIRGAEDTLSKTWNTFTESLNNGDYKTAGLYAIGAAALIKLAIGSSGKGGSNIFWGLAAPAAVYMFSKKAGYDLLEMSGLSSREVSAARTPFEYMQCIIDTNPSLRRRGADIDYGIVMRLDSTNVTLQRLNDQLKRTDTPGSGRPEGFIPPEEFGNTFPAEVLAIRNLDIERARRQRQGQGQALSPEQKEYLRIGEQLYKIAFAFRQMYTETLEKSDRKDERYKDISYEDAISMTDGGIRTPQELMAAIAPYTEVMQRRIEEMRIDDTLDRINQIFRNARAHYIIGIVERIDDDNFRGLLSDVPIKIEKHEGKYRIYISEGGGNFSDPPPTFELDPGEEGNEWFTGVEANWESAVRRRIDAHFGDEEDIGFEGDAELTYNPAGRHWVAEVTVGTGDDARSTSAIVTFNDRGDIEHEIEGEVRRRDRDTDPGTPERVPQNISRILAKGELDDDNVSALIAHYRNNNDLRELRFPNLERMTDDIARRFENFNRNITLIVPTSFVTNSSSAHNILRGHFTIIEITN